MLGQLHTLTLVWNVLAWLAAYEVASWLVAFAQRRALICWSIGPLGISAIYLHRPPRGVLMLQITVPILVFAAASYIGLYVVHPSPMVDVSQRPLVRIGTTVIALVAATGLQAVRFLGEFRFPVWGEARVLACVQRSRALGSVVLFTPLGRTFLRERFGATPQEFLLTLS